jgi:hypothetical protein
MIGFIQRSGVVVAMIGMLQAFPGTKLYSRLRQSGRLVTPASGNNTDCYPNFKTKIPIEKLVQGYKRIVGEIYSPKKYYERIRNFLENYRPFTGPKKRINATDVRSLLKVSLRIGLFGGPTASYYYWKTIFVALTKQPRAFPEVVADWVYAAHFLSRARRVQGL